MNIGIDARPALAARTGVGAYVYNLVPALAAAAPDNAYHLFSNSFRDRFSLPANPSNCHVHDYRLPNVLMNLLWEPLGKFFINRLCRDLDVFHFTGKIAPPPEKAATVATVYDLHHVRYPERVDAKHRIAHERLRRDLNSVAKIIAISAFTKSDLVELLGIAEEKIAVIPLGVDTQVFKPADKNECAAHLKTRFRLEGDFLLAVGTLEVRKNLPVLVDAFALVRQRHPGMQLVLAGVDGNDAARLREKIRSLRLADVVYFTGYIPDERDLRFLYCGARVFVFPSMYEGFGLPLLEAFACGAPVAAADRTALPEVAGAAALFFDPERAEEMAERILQVLENSDMTRELRSRGFARAKNFTWAGAAGKTAELYRLAKRDAWP